MKNQTLLSLLLAFVVLALVSSCSKDDDEPVQTTNEGQFTVTITNAASAKSYLNSGTIDAIPPGQSLSLNFDAGKGAHLSLATMLAQSNDLFYAPGEAGIALYDANGTALTGDITAEFDLWDAGTEVNQEPGVGADQAPRQSAANTGAAENGTVELITAINDGFTYPADEAVLKAELAHDGGTTFTLTLTNLSDGASLTSPLAPGVFVIHNDGTPLFSEGQVSGGALEALAEDGNNALLGDELAAETGYVSPFAPGVWVVHNNTSTPIFKDGEQDAGQGLEELAEDGDPGVLNASLTGATGVQNNGIFNTPVGATDPGPLFPGAAYQFTFDAEEGDYLNFATMLVQTNDLFFAFDEEGIALFQNGNPVSGTFTASVSLWDAGTEVNEYPGAGNNQPVRGGGNSGPSENGVVQVVNDGFTYPAVNNLIEITIESNK